MGCVCLTLPESVLPVLLHLLFVPVCWDKKLASGALEFLSEFSYCQVPKVALLKPEA